MSDTVDSPIFTLTYNGKDVSKNIAPYLESLTFVDSIEGESSSLDIELENTDMLFANGWYPEKGATLGLMIGAMDCGIFTMDAIKLKGPPHTIVMKALTNVVTKKALKTKRSRAHSKKTLAQIAQLVANANGLTIVGKVPDIAFDHVTQKRETDLKFLRRISWDYGIIFSVRDSKLIFTYLPNIDSRKAAFSIDKTELTDYDIEDKTDKTYSKATVASHNPKTKEVVTGTATPSQQLRNAAGEAIKILQNQDGVDYTQIVAADTKVIHKKVENQQQANSVAAAAIYRANSWVQSGSITMPGREEAIAGNNAELCGLGPAASGIYNMTKTTHTITRPDSWNVTIDVKRVSTVNKIKQRGIKMVQPTQANIQYLKNKDGVEYTQITQ